MKVRIGFVSNSSSSSFVVFTHVEVKNYQDILGLLDVDYIGRCKSWDDVIVTPESVAKYIFGEIESDGPQKVIKSPDYIGCLFDHAYLSTNVDLVGMIKDGEINTEDCYSGGPMWPIFVAELLKAHDVCDRYVKAMDIYDDALIDDVGFNEYMRLRDMFYELGNPRWNREFLDLMSQVLLVYNKTSSGYQRLNKWEWMFKYNAGDDNCVGAISECEDVFKFPGAVVIRNSQH